MFEDESSRDRGRRLRTESTDQERELWRILRAKRFGGFKFRRNHPIGSYFADFCCVKQRLIVELDGGQHGEPEQGRKDAIRTNFLIARGYRIIRFRNEQLKQEQDELLEAIYAALTEPSWRA